ncbi:unnamed protein product [Cyclocybe aegerita]|uniref:Major facilitator superfamily (MFS) profile domain-containing protein n=1 Tax=Cyclocybe aegerita TaxID=1973307 RepID=A0A8S0WI93_CYCAE|nr:unnamed protein product [Cyclocybe aegerita]
MTLASFELQDVASKRRSTEPSVHSVARSARSPSKSRVDVAQITGLANDEAASRNATTTSTATSRTRKQKIVAHVQFFTLCWTLFLLGWNDGTIGPLLPRIREVYGVGTALVSLTFVFACVGFVSGALLNMYLTGKMSFGKILVFGSLFQVAAYAIQCSAPPFPVFFFAYALNGIGLALQDAQANSFVATLKHSETRMGILHSVYGIGAFAAPLVATQFAQLPRWSFHFLTSLGLAISNTATLALVFKLKDQDDCLRDAGEIIPENSSEGEKGAFKQIMTTKAVHLVAFFILVYVGVEVTIGGWIVTFIIEVREGGPSSGYIASGFFGGLALGRVILLWVNKKIGERRVLFLYGILSIALEITVWFVPSLIQNAVAVSIVGVLLGPMCPIAINQTSRILPRRILTGAIGWIAGFGQAGSALLPFITGAIASSRGLKSLQPLLVSMMGFLMVLWALVPNDRRLD